MKLTRRGFLQGLGIVAVSAVVPKGVIRKGIEPDEDDVAYTHGYSIINGVRISDELLGDAAFEWPEHIMCRCEGG